MKYLVAAYYSNTKWEIPQLVRKFDSFRVTDTSDVQTPSFPKGFITLRFY